MVGDRKGAQGRLVPQGSKEALDNLDPKVAWEEQVLLVRLGLPVQRENQAVRGGLDLQVVPVPQVRLETVEQLDHVGTLETLDLLVARAWLGQRDHRVHQVQEDQLVPLGPQVQQG